MPDIHYPAVTHLDRADDLGIDLDKLVSGKALQDQIARAEELETVASAAFSATLYDRQRLAEQFVAGEISLTDLYAISACNASTEARTRVLGVLEVAQQTTERAVIVELAKIGDKWITHAIRPSAAAAVERIAAAAANIGPGWTDDTIHLSDDEAERKAFAHAQDGLDELLQLRRYALNLTGANNNTPIIKTKLAELRRPDRWQDIPGVPVYSVLEAIRRDAEPGIWLASEVEHEAKSPAA